MILGHGDIGSVLTDREDVTFFASGVSNSRETRNSAFVREYVLLLDQPKSKHLVYFSSLCTYDSSTPYANHKKSMEAAVKFWFDSYTIVRLGNISWGVNPNTLINYLKAHPEAEVREVYRHIITLKEFKYWMELIPVGQKNEMNLPGNFVWVPDLKKSL